MLDFYFKKGARILNFKSLKKWPRLEQDKLIQHLIFQKKHLPFVQSDVYGKAEVLKNKIINFPKVIKAAYGSHGDNVFKVESKKDLRKIITKYPPSSLLVQPYLPGGQDLRVIVLGGRAIGAMKRIAQRGQFLTNYSAGGMVKKFELDQTTKELAEKAARAFFLDYVGVDLMKDEKGWWRILEVNRACQFKGFEKATGINLARKVIEYLLERK